MKPHPKTIALVAVAAGMLTGAYLLAPLPAPAATSASSAQAAARQAQTPQTSAPSRLATYVKTLQAPVPLVVGKHDQYFDASAAPEAAATTPSALMQQASLTSANDSAAKASIEMDGYRNVRGLVRTSDGTWRARAMRGSVEIAVTVDANGNVSQD